MKIVSKYYVYYVRRQSPVYKSPTYVTIEHLPQQPMFCRFDSRGITLILSSHNLQNRVVSLAKSFR